MREQRSCKTAPALRACLSRRLWRWPWRARSSNCGTAAATITLSLFLARNLLSANSSGAAYAALLRFVAILTSSALDLASRCVPFRGEASSEGTMRAVLELWCVRSELVLSYFWYFSIREGERVLLWKSEVVKCVSCLIPGCRSCCALLRIGLMRRADFCVVHWSLGVWLEFLFIYLFIFVLVS